MRAAHHCPGKIDVGVAGKVNADRCVRVLVEADVLLRAVGIDDAAAIGIDAWVLVLPPSHRVLASLRSRATLVTYCGTRRLVLPHPTGFIAIRCITGIISSVAPSAAHRGLVRTSVVGGGPTGVGRVHVFPCVHDQPDHHIGHLTGGDGDQVVAVRGELGVHRVAVLVEHGAHGHGTGVERDLRPVCAAKGRPEKRSAGALP